jgi:hypothetical protein
VIAGNFPLIVLCCLALVALYAGACMYFGNDM